MFHLWPRVQYQTLNTIYINSDAIVHNHLALQQFHPEAAICPVLKANAYGHGLTTVAPIFDKLNCPFLCVDSLFEAYELMKQGVKTTVLILGYTAPVNFQVKRLPFEYVIYDLEMARALAKYQPGCRVHVFVDTGMNREGVPMSELPKFLKQLQELPQLKVVGACSHLADADNSHTEIILNQQLSTFKKALQLIEAAGFKLEWKHLTASGGAFKIHDPVCNLIRAGLAHYGLNPLASDDLVAQKVQAQQPLKLQPALEFTTTIVQLKQIEAGERVGYNGTYTARKKMTIGLLPAGYYEGVDRRLSNLGIVTVNNQVCKIIGRVSMDMTTIDVSNVKNVKVGDLAVIYSADPDAHNSVAAAAASIGTIPYELLVHLAESVKREVKV